MAEIIKAVSEAADKHGIAFAAALVVIILLALLMVIHLHMLKKWADSNERMAKASDERVGRVEQRHDQVLVGNLSLQKSLIEVNASQNQKLDLLVQATKDATQKVAEQAEQGNIQVEILTSMKAGQIEDRKLAQLDRDWWIKIGSDSTKICKISDQSPGSDSKTAK